MSKCCPVCLQPRGVPRVAALAAKFEFALCPACGRAPSRLFDRDYRRRAREFAAGPRPPERLGLVLYARRQRTYTGAAYGWVYADKAPHHPLTSIWRAMLYRCYDKDRDNYKYYGARGIAVCKRWRDSFEAFAADMGPRPPGTTLDRKNNDGNYTPKNCHWATTEEQHANRRSTQQLIVIRGVPMTVVEAARFYGIRKATILSRLQDGWTPDRAVTTPLSRRRR